MRRCLVVVAVCVFTVAALANERGDRANAEWQKYMDRGLNACVGGGSVYLTYSPLDRRDWYPVQFSPNLQPDIIKRAAAIEPGGDAKTYEAINTDVNAFVNQHLDELRNGTYNKIEVKVAGIQFAVTPANDRSDQVLVWLHENTATRGLWIVHELNKRLFIMQPSGTAEPVNRNNEPKWLTTDHLTEATEEAGVRAGRAHAAHFSKCN